MNFVISSKALLQQLQVIGGVVSSNSNVPILNDFLFEVKDGILTISGSDIETTISAQLSADQVNAKTDGSVAMPARFLMDTLKTFADVPLTFTVDVKTNSVSVSSDSGKYKLSGHNASEFPPMPEIQATGSLSVESTTLAHAIHKTLFAAGNDELRPVISGVLLEMDADICNFTATDAHKLVCYKRKDLKASTYGSIIIPKKPLNILKNILATLETTIQISYSDSNVKFEFDEYILVSRLIEGKYPNYEAIIPKNNLNKLQVEKSSLLSAIRRVSIFSNKTTYQVRLKIAGSDLQIMAEDLDFANEAHERLTCQYDGDDMEIGFNSRFLIEMIQNVDGEYVLFELSEPSRPGIIKPAEIDAEVEDITMLVMPIILTN